MYGAAFERPLIMFVGLGFPRQINNATDALQVLADLPQRYHGPAYSTACKACRAAIAGDVEPETARGILEAYARDRAMLADSLLAPHAINARRELLGA